MPIVYVCTLVVYVCMYTCRVCMYGSNGEFTELYTKTIQCFLFVKELKGNMILNHVCDTYVHTYSSFWNKTNCDACTFGHITDGLVSFFLQNSNRD